MAVKSTMKVLLWQRGLLLEVPVIESIRVADQAIENAFRGTDPTRPSSSSESRAPDSAVRSNDGRLKTASLSGSKREALDDDNSADDDVPLVSLKGTKRKYTPSDIKFKRKYINKKKVFRFSAPSSTWKSDFYEERYHEKKLRDLHSVSLTGQMECCRSFFDRQSRHGRQYLPGNRPHSDVYYLDLAFLRQLPVQLDRVIPGIEFQTEIRLRASDLAYNFADQLNCSAQEFLGIFDYGALLALGMLVREFSKNLIRPVLSDHFYKRTD